MDSSLTDPCSAGCPPEWLNYRDKCYFFSKDLLNFDSAKTTCESVSASLLIIRDREEQVSLVALTAHVYRNNQELVDVCHCSGTEMAEEASPGERLLLDRSDRPGGGERLALAGRD